MNTKEIKKWVGEAINKGYDRDDVTELLAEQVDEGKMTKDSQKKVLDLYDKTTQQIEKNKISFFERRRLKKNIRKLRRLVDDSDKVIQSVTKHTKALDKKEKKNIQELRDKMIVAITGDKGKGLEGLSQIFEIEDEDTGKPIRKEDLEGYKLEEIEELLKDLLDQLETEI